MPVNVPGNVKGAPTTARPTEIRLRPGDTWDKRGAPRRTRMCPMLTLCAIHGARRDCAPVSMVREMDVKVVISGTVLT